ncbi:MAG: 5-(carboxyamino)imidazole ribonucleotide synthase [Trueperaceae bacterium]|nr:5-(carboxyamino)imidazole ribonucleotide synthase [Trueperaceae bacterium]
MSDAAPILPGATLGILGSGQLGRMLALAARRLGYRVRVFSPDHDSPTGQVADAEVSADYSDLDAVRDFARTVDVITLEFENVPAATLETALEYTRVHPSPLVLSVAQNRLREKTFLSEAGFPVTPFRAVDSAAALGDALAALGTPAILKTAGFGYDGKGQYRVDNLADAEVAFAALDQQTVLEARVDFKQELSVIVARNGRGEVADFGVIDNLHRQHILDLSLAPSLLPAETVAVAVRIAHEIAAGLELIGVLCVEFFLTQDDRLLVNEIAPRPHNSGHLSVDACLTDQFEQQLRAVCGLGLGSTELLRPAATANLLGDVWQGGVPDWAALSTRPDVKLHLYGKAEPRPGRKMGHLTALGPNRDEARDRVLAARALLTSS